MFKFNEKVGFWQGKRPFAEQQPPITPKRECLIWGIDGMICGYGWSFLPLSLEWIWGQISIVTRCYACGPAVARSLLYRAYKLSFGGVEMKKVVSSIVASLVAVAFAATVFAAPKKEAAAPAAPATPAVAAAPATPASEVKKEEKAVKKVKKVKKAKKAVKKEAVPATPATPAAK
jgi:hypothetical protein